MRSSPISRLAPEILLKIFSILAQDTDATVAFSILCCKRWQVLAQSALYSDIHLSGQRLIKFANASGTHNETRSLTLQFGPVLVNQYDPQEGIQTAESWLEALRELLPRIGQMTSLESFSISADLPLPYSAGAVTSSIIAALPTTCTSLEVDLCHSTFVQQKLGTAVTDSAHLCDPIRSVLNRLHHLRLRLPKTCSALFGEDDDDGYHPVAAQNLRTCIINLSQRTPGTSPRASWAASCTSPHVPHIGSRILIAPVLPALIPKMQSFVQTNPSISRLWVIEPQARGQGKNSWAAWIRRDVVSDASWPIPLANIGGFRKDAWLARLPNIGDAELSRDIISSPEMLEAAAEGFAWIEGKTGVRLPTSVFMARDHVCALDAPRTRTQLEDGEDLSCTLWENEDITGESLLPKGPGALMETWDLNESTPDGWSRQNFAGSAMVRLSG